LQPGSTEKERAMASFIFETNIAHYKKLLATEKTDARKIDMLHKLLAEEEAKFADWRAKNPNSDAAE
jgi:predicted class III extradiol MEMO1 family dioxygenase